jgi:hypothetical protein
MITKDEYEQAKANGKLEELRGDMISKRIRRKYSPSAQIAVDKNIIKDLVRGTKEHYAKWEAYEAYRETVKAEVDEILAGFEKINI